MPRNTNQSKQSNYSMEFDGSGSQYINFGTDVLVDSTSSFSISVWCYINDYNTIQFPGIGRFKTDQSTGFFFGISNYSGYEGVYFGSNSNFVLGKTSGDISGDFVGQWKHITIVFDVVSRTTLSSYKVYVDGSEVSTTTSGSFNTVANENRLAFGIIIGYNDTANRNHLMNFFVDKNLIYWCVEPQNDYIEMCDNIKLNFNYLII